jgi:tetratricopeptide (TPR) repeat protein
MKRGLLLLLSLTISVAALAQKKELKAAEKSLKKGLYGQMNGPLKVVKAQFDGLDDKYKAKYLYLSAMAIYGKGTNVAKDVPAAKALSKVIAFEKKTKSFKYTKQAQTIKGRIVAATAKKGSDFYKEKKYNKAADNFENVFVLSKADTVFLENAALSSFFAKDYDRSIKLYKKLLNLGYTGISKQFIAQNLVNGEDLRYNTQKEMNAQVKLKIAKNPKVVVTPSRVGDITKNIALSYIAKGEEQSALDAIADAKKIFPNDYNLVISEANIYFKLGNNEKFLEGLKKAISLKPNDPSLHYNVGVLTLDQGYIKEAIGHFEKAIELKPDYGDAYNNIGVAVLKKNDAIVEEMNKNLSNFKKYDALQLEQKVVYKEALPFLLKASELSPKNDSLLKTLSGLYEFLGMYKEQKEIQAKIDAL